MRIEVSLRLRRAEFNTAVWNAGVNAAVVGVLGAALYNPILTRAILSARDLAIALIASILLERWRFAPILIVGFCIAAAATLAAMR